MPITTGKVRLSYCHIWQPQAPKGDNDPKYSVTILIPKSDLNTLNLIYAEIEAAKQAGISSTWGGVLPPLVKIPLYDGDGVRPSGEPFGDECRGHMVMTASAKNQPSVVDLNVQPILNQSEVYSGCYARVNLNFFSYLNSGNKGIGCGLNSIQKVADGEPLAGGVSAQEAFGGKNAYQNAQQGQPMTQVPPPYYGAQAPQQYQTPPVQQPPQQYQTLPQYQAPPVPQTQPQYQAPPIPQPPQAPPVYQTPQTPPVYQAAPVQGYPQQFPGQGVDPITGQPQVGAIMGM